MGPYRKYLFTGKPISRSTLHSRRRSASLRLQKLQQILAEQVTADAAVTEVPVEQGIETIDHSVAVGASTCGDNTRLTDQDRDSDPPQSLKSYMAANDPYDDLDVIHCPSEFVPDVEDIVTDIVCNDRVNSSEDPSPPVTVNERQHPSDNTQCESTSINCKEQLKILTSKICDCVDTTVGDVVYMCLAVGVKHNLTWESIIDFIKVFHSVHENCNLPLSRKSLLKIVDNKETDIFYHIFCPECEVYCGKRWTEKWSVRCNVCVADIEVDKLDDDFKFHCPQCEDFLAQKTNEDWFIQCVQCHQNVAVLAQSNFFITLSLEKQIFSLLRNESLAQALLTHRFNRNKANNDAIEDIYDGEEYQKLCKDGGILSSPLNFSYNFFTDGISTGKSTCKTMWPIYASLNELPFEERSQNIFLVGLYVGHKDPSQAVFLEPFIDEANKLSSTGLSWMYKGNLVNSKVIPLCFILDSVARFQVLNMQTFHAFYGCTYCYQEQERTAPRKRRFNVFTEAEERSKDSTYQDALVAYEKRDSTKIEDRSYRGVKGPSILFKLQFFNLIWGCVIDYMHAILLGIVKTHMKFLFESSNRKFWVDTGDSVAIKDIIESIDKRLLNITPPSSITRTPRSLSMWKNWKASEWRSWILFYCLPCLDGLLKEKYLVHLAMLCKATFILLQNSITVVEVDEAHVLLREYSQLFQRYLKPVDTIYNLHLLGHIKKCVLSWGPLWAQNAFCFESQNRHILQLYKSPNFVLMQIARRFMIYSGMPSLLNKMVSTYGTVEFCEELLNRRLVNFVRCGNTVLFGKISNLVVTEEEKEILWTCHQVQPDECFAFSRMLVNGMRLTSIHYAAGKQNNDSYVICFNGDVVSISHIVVLPSKMVALLGQKLKKRKRRLINDTKVTIDHLRSLKRRSHLVCISASDIKCQGVVIRQSQDLAFVSPVPIGCKGD